MIRSVEMIHRREIVVLLLLAVPMVVHAQTNNGQNTQTRLKRWSFTANATLYGGGLSEEITKSMCAGGFDDPTTKWLFGSGTITHPKCYPELSSSITLSYRCSERLAFRLIFGTAGVGSIHGYNGDVRSFIFLRESHTTTALIPSLIAGEVARIGIGPALHRLEVQRDDATGGPGSRRTRIGIVSEAGLTLPAETRWFMDIMFQYWYAGSAEVGPFTTSNRSGGNASIPRTRISLNRIVVSAGIGIRF
jgi:hypothetical protein